ncbi:hypothetical protein M8818_000491 [Zalaria obscura]|uniref:Uncharacterized protein n=1 Tax=Zalaria obscura TaxID=2024903 RepID=A0ACC3SQJ7_9PEZI
MTTYKLEDSELEGLKGKTILITGCATGIGRATVLIAHTQDTCRVAAFSSHSPFKVPVTPARSVRSRKLENHSGFTLISLDEATKRHGQSLPAYKTGSRQAFSREKSDIDPPTKTCQLRRYAGALGKKAHCWAHFAHDSRGCPDPFPCQ